ncbi:MAG TPA: folylpolyglutamate synthase/dihydrofolate synthase family protein [Acidobacteriaceae bacterium]|jgi:dihydrofolate synthase/folylpolyglutamate synthase|nr:folylpolyglutamate synthase/dihydrofolate synthase family protein [Acidobacteriaceae bacterium]
MTYEEALARLAAMGAELRTGKAGAARKWSLDHIRALLLALGEPQRQFRSVLIAGTNGKGSTAATLASILNSAGVRTGLYTSPHLTRVNERVRVSGDSFADGSAGLREIGDEDFGRIFERVDEAAQALVREGMLPHAPSFFEVLTALAFCYFAEQRVELAVLEVGLGGRLDATNVVEPIVSVITDIGLDHMEFLGDTIGAIAREKAGILRENGVLVTLAQHPEANQAIGEAAVEKNVRGVDAARCLPANGFKAVDPEYIDINASGIAIQGNQYPILVEGKILNIDSPLGGQHQRRNIALAVATALELRMNHGFSISNDAIERGIRATEWPGRLEWIRSRAGEAPLLLDVAHNPAGAWALRAAIAQLPQEKPRTLIFSCLADKEIREMAQILFPLFDARSGDSERAGDHILLAPIHNARAATAEDLLAAAQELDVPAHAAPHVAGALAEAESVTPGDGVIVATGSLYLIGELRELALARLAAAFAAEDK